MFLRRVVFACLMFVPFVVSAYTVRDDGFFVERDRIRLYYEISGAKKGDYFKLYIIGNDNKKLYEQDFNVYEGKHTLSLPMVYFDISDVKGYYIFTANGKMNRNSIKNNRAKKQSKIKKQPSESVQQSLDDETLFDQVLENFKRTNPQQ